MINQLGCTATQAGEIEEAERMRSMLEHESWQEAELLPQGWRWRQDPKVILRSYRREAQENNLLFEVFVSAIIPPPKIKKLSPHQHFVIYTQPTHGHNTRSKSLRRDQCNSGQLNACNLHNNCTISGTNKCTHASSWTCYCCLFVCLFFLHELH